MTTNIIPLPAPENQPKTERSLPTSTWKLIKQQLFKLFEQGLSDPFNKEAAAIILGKGSLGPANSELYEPGVLYVTGLSRKYLRRAERRFQSFHKEYYGWERKPRQSFSAEELRTYRLMFYWEQARKAFEAQKKNLRQNQNKV
jgi:hypothetical protein